MPHRKPVAELDPRYSSEGAEPTAWSEALELLESAELYWLSTVRPDGRPHVTPLIAVWLDGALHFCTGPGERKAHNLSVNPNAAVTTGTNALGHGLDLVVEGAALPVAEETALRRLAAAYEAKYGSEWHFEVRDGAFHGEAGGRALVFGVTPTTVFGFRKGAYSQTRWRF